MIRENVEQIEKNTLSTYATLSKNSKGREKKEKECDIRTCFQRDRDRILHSKSFRRLKHKTQVFLSPEGDHYRTRLTHTLEVSQLSRTIARALGLNEDLTEAIALGHDLGHTPFGHAGEFVMDKMLKKYGKHFAHNEQSVRVVETLENGGRGLNLTWEVRDGIKNHGTSGKPSTLEGKIVRICDKIAYINHDIDDSIRAGVLTEEMLPKEYIDILGHTVRNRINTLIQDIVKNSNNICDIIQSVEVGNAMKGLRSFMFQSVYKNKLVVAEEEKVHHILKGLFFHYFNEWKQLPYEYVELIESGKEAKEIVVCDYISGMTDSFAVSKYEEIFVPKSWKRM